MSEYGHRIHHLKGTPFEMGYAMGRSLGPRLEANIARYVRERVSRGVELDVERWRSEALPWLRCLPARFREELRGMAEGAQLPLQRLAEWIYLEVILSGRCSGAVVTLGGRVWVARNNDIFAPGMWGYAAIREVSGRIPTITFGLEGDVFTSTGINRERLWLHYNYLPAWDAPDGGGCHLPCYAFVVEALERCCTLGDLEALLDEVQRDEAMLLFAVDGKSEAYALYECGCTDHRKREPTRGWLVGTNHYCVHPCAPSLDDARLLSTLTRYERMETLVEDLAARGDDLSPVEALIRILADEAVEARAGETVTVYANVACPATGEIWYTFGGYPAASRGNWQRLAWPW